ncbi:MAG: AzlC family ABC transporter permease [Oscillospiraceae bacterium]
MNKKQCFVIGLRDSVPIFLGYLSVSFAFGITASSRGIPIWVTILISVTNLTSAGQLAGIGIIATGGAFAEMIASQLTINLRYALMSLSLSQKLDNSFTQFSRMGCSFGITDEIYAVAQGKTENVSKYYLWGLIFLPLIGWSLGTTIGALCGDILPKSITTALGIALFGMFIAIIIPPVKKQRKIALVVLISIFISCIVKYVPFFNFLTDGFAIIISAVVASLIGAIFLPIKQLSNDT